MNPLNIGDIYNDNNKENLKNFSPQKIADETRNYLKKVFLWLFAGIFISGLVSYFVYGFFKNNDFGISGYLLPLAVIAFIVQLVICLILIWAIKKISKVTAQVLFILYAIITGMTFSFIFFAFSIKTITLTFFVTSIMFLILSIVGYKTKKDISKFSTILFSGLMCLILVSVVNLFMGNNFLDFIVSVIGVLVFMGFTIFDVYSIKKFNIIGNEGTDEDEKEVIVGAFNLYLDFVNLFINLLKVINDIT